jgi:hypothetical protein
MPEIIQTSYKRPVFVVASWLLPSMAWLVAYFAVSAAKSKGGFMPGLGEAVASAFIVALSAFACGLIAVLRRERYRWLGLFPLLAGLCALIYFSWLYFR